jgi:hypothetical protein
LDDHYRGGGNHNSGKAPLGSAFGEVAHLKHRITNIRSVS